MTSAGRGDKGQSIHAYAAHRKDQGLPGGSPWSVKKALRDGRISRNEHGKIDPDAADRQWDQNTDPAQQRDPEKLRQAATERLAQQPAQREQLAVPSYSQSRAVKEAYQARIARLQYEEMTGRLVSSDAIKVETFRRVRMARDQILAVPDRVAAILAAESEAAKVKFLLETELRQVLEVLSHD